MGYPQEVIIGFGRPVSIRTIKTNTRNVRNFAFSFCEAPKVESKESWVELLDGVEKNEIDRGAGKMQSEKFNLSVGQDRTAHFIKFTIHSGWDDFCVVHNVSVEGASSGGATGFAN